MTLSELLIRFAYWLQASARYAGLKGFFRRLLTDPRSHRRVVYDGAMIGLVLTSVYLLIYEVRHPLGFWADVFEAFVVTVFVAEYLLRMWLHNDSHRILIEQWEHAELVGTRFRASWRTW